MKNIDFLLLITSDSMFVCFFLSFRRKGTYSNARKGSIDDGGFQGSSGLFPVFRGRRRGTVVHLVMSRISLITLKSGNPEILVQFCSKIKCWWVLYCPNDPKLAHPSMQLPAYQLNFWILAFSNSYPPCSKQPFKCLILRWSNASHQGQTLRFNQ